MFLLHYPQWNKEPNVKVGYVSRREDLVHYGGITAL
jgi:hypothetical protein